MVNLNSIRWREQTDGLLTLGRIIVGVVFGLLALSFWSLQIGQYDRLAEMAENNHDRTISLRAPRGALVDRNGNVLVDNRYTFNISVIRERVADLDSSLDLIGRVTGADVDALRAAVLDQRDVPAFRPIVIVPDASLAQVAAVQARAIELPGVIVEHDPARYYPSRKTASHLFGYVGEAQEHQLRDVSDPRVRLGAIIGQSGVEQSYNLLLMGENGARRVAVNNVGREIETIDQVSPRQGRQLRLTIDLDVQQAAEEAFAISGFDGAAVALDPRTGEVLALVSLPAYDPADFVPRVDRQTWSTLNSDARRPLQNRVLQGRYAPGSTFKVAMAVAALEEGAITPDFSVNCGGGARFYQRFFRCHTRHGRVALHEALEKSCNTYFYTLGSMLDIDRIHHWAAALGLGEPSGIDLPHEVPGLVPSRAWKRLQFNQPWYPRRDAVGGDRPGRGVGDARIAGRDDVHGRLRRPAAGAAHAAGRALGERLGGGGPAGAAAGRPETRNGGGRPRGALDGRESRRHGPPGADYGTRRHRQDRHGAGDLAGGPRGGEGGGRQRPAVPRPWLVRVRGAAGRSADCRRRVRRACRARLPGRADRQGDDRGLLRQARRT